MSPAGWRSTAAGTALAGLPAGALTTRADALHVVEALELLLDAGQWQSADDLYLNRSDDGQMWQHLPAAGWGSAPPPRLWPPLPAVPTAPPASLRTVLVSTWRAPDCMRCLLVTWPPPTSNFPLPSATSGTRGTGRTCRPPCRTWPSASAIWGRAARPRPPQPRRSPAPSQPATGRRFVPCTHTWGGWPTWSGTLQPPSSTSPQPTRSASPTTRTTITCTRTVGIWWVGWLARTGRPSPAQKLTHHNAQICRRNDWTTTWPGATGCWAGWPWPPGIPPRPART